MLIELLQDPNVWLSLLTLTALEIVLGIDNIIFLSIISAKLPLHQQAAARRIGLILALAGRIILLFSLTWLIGLTKPLFHVFDVGISVRDLILGLGGLFLIVKGTMEMHEMLEGDHEAAEAGSASWTSVIIQILLLDLVFSLDSVITAIGMAEHLPVMVTAVIISIIVMLFAAEPVSKFVNDHPTVKMLALSFLLLVGLTLVADGAHFHIPRAYLYVAIAFSLFVEMLNLMASSARKKRKLKNAEKTGASS